MEIKRKHYSVPLGPVDDRCFDSETLLRNSSWKLSAPESLSRESAMLAEWAADSDHALGKYRHGIIDLPSVTELANEIRNQLDNVYGVAWVSGFPVNKDLLPTSLLYLAIGAALGTVIETYGRLYDVIDQGDSYKDKAIPVSQTKQSTGMHTDSSRLHNVPDYVGLLCLHPAEQGGSSIITSAAQAHEAVRYRDPELLKVLYRDYFRDVVTPGADRDISSIADNKFPIFFFENGLTMRYMRYWIETGHKLVGVPLGIEEIKAMNLLDEELSHKDHLFRFHLARGDMLWVANRVVAHDRDTYEEDADCPRWLLRQWVCRHSK